MMFGGEDGQYFGCSDGGGASLSARAGEGMAWEFQGDRSTYNKLKSQLLRVSTDALQSYL
jgi:hypothetical protein